MQEALMITRMGGRMLEMFNLGIGHPSSKNMDWISSHQV